MDEPNLVLTSVLPSSSTQHQSANYDNYLSVMAALSDMSSEEEDLNQAILASLQSERLVKCKCFTVPNCFVVITDFFYLGFTVGNF